MCAAAPIVLVVLVLDPALRCGGVMQCPDAWSRFIAWQLYRLLAGGSRE
jgi:hypothetical protein